MASRHASPVTLFFTEQTHSALPHEQFGKLLSARQYIPSYHHVQQSFVAAIHSHPDKPDDGQKLGACHILRFSQTKGPNSGFASEPCSITENKWRLPSPSSKYRRVQGYSQSRAINIGFVTGSPRGTSCQTEGVRRSNGCVYRGPTRKTEYLC